MKGFQGLNRLQWALIKHLFPKPLPNKFGRKDLSPKKVMHTILQGGMMKKIRKLETTLSHFFDWNKAWLNGVVQILQALFCVRTVNLTQITAPFQPDV